jgi:hypothetical protein
MSFGTTGRARTINELPLRQRFSTPAWFRPSEGEAFEPWELGAYVHWLDAHGLQGAHSGWDADGRPVEP